MKKAKIISLLLVACLLIFVCLDFLGRYFYIVNIRDAISDCENGNIKNISISDIKVRSTNDGTILYGNGLYVVIRVKKMIAKIT